MTYVEINGNRYVATIGGRMHDGSWDGRESKYIRAEITKICEKYPIYE